MRIENLSDIVTAITGRSGEWAACEVNLIGTSGFGAVRRLLRDYSVMDFEFTLSGRGTYTYFFCGTPSGWGLRKNFAISSARPLEDYRIGAMRRGDTASPISLHPFNPPRA